MRRVTLYAMPMLVSSISPLLYIPVVTHVTGARGWAAIAVGQSIGAAAAVLVGYGWIFDGPRQLAEVDPSRHPSILRSALGSQLYLALIAAAGVVPVVMVTSEDLTLPALLAALAGLLGGLSPTW